MTYLLDTHALIWAIEFPDRLSARVRALIADEENALFVSAISAFELANKVRLGKLPAGEKLHANYEALLLAAGISSVPVSAAIALRAARLVAEHRDPFDRIIAATSLAADIPLLSVDEALDEFHVRRIW